MAVQIRFLGAARNVTGSRYLVECGDSRVLVDCGMHQERQFKDRDWQDFAVPPRSIDAIVLTHAHLDHCGFLPRLVKHGFQGTIYGTPATCEIARIVLLDSAHIQEEDVKHKKRRHRREKRKSPYGYEPLYTKAHANATLDRFEAVPYREPVQVAPGIRASWRDAGHILGSTTVRITATDGGEERSIVFSGDLGRIGTPIVRDPVPPEPSNAVIMESTYGDRLHGPEADIPELLAKVINETVEAGGNLVIPAFAIGRTQELLYHLSALLEAGRIPPLPVFLDSPMAIRVTEVFIHHPELFDEEMVESLRRTESPFGFHGLHMTRTVAQSKGVNFVRGSVIVIAGSGMCTGGRIKHHLVHNIGRPASTLLFVGYQANGTLGRRILDGDDEVRIFGKRHRVRARVVKIPGLSAHADRDELTAWFESIPEPPAHLIITHGEEESALAFAERMGGRFAGKVTVPEYGEVVELG